LSLLSNTLGEEFAFQQDNNLKHKATYTLELLTKTTLNVPEWPSYSFDLNQLEYLWQDRLLAVTGGVCVRVYVCVCVAMCVCVTVCVWLPMFVSECSSMQYAVVAVDQITERLAMASSHSLSSPGPGK
jgi:hypothetical protein